jgi:hypothetical protein
VAADVREHYLAAAAGPLVAQLEAAARILAAGPAPADADRVAQSVRATQ